MEETADYEWNPSARSVVVRTFSGGSKYRRTLILAQHSTAPFRCHISESETISEDLVIKVACTYLTELDRVQRENQCKDGLGLPETWLKSLTPTGTAALELGWLPVRPAFGAAVEHPKPEPSSHRLIRIVADKSGHDTTIVLVAGALIAGARSNDPVCNNTGVRVVLNLVETEARWIEIRSMTAHLPPSCPAPEKASAHESNGCCGRHVGYARNASAGTTINAYECGAQTAAHVRVLEQDPASWRDPTSAIEQPPPYDPLHRRMVATGLDRFRTGVAVDNPLASPDGDFLIRNSPNFVRSDPETNAARMISPSRPSWPEVQSDDHSAVSAYHNARSIFRTVRELGLDPERYFRRAKRPVQVFYRSGMRDGPGKDGRTINARVELSSTTPGELPEIELHFAMANLNRMGRDLTKPAEKRWAEPIGLATAERWVCHEFGHVLIAAALGEAEFRFAHSFGDALAAIWADPYSILADPRVMHDGTTVSVSGQLRGATFPGVFTTRRHDRCVRHGWSWTGSFQRPVTLADEIDHDTRKGYLSEQILSTTLFRLYRILGGDSVLPDSETPDIARRFAASRLVIYLLLRAVESFGHVPIRAEELEAAMIDADLGLKSPLTLNPSADHPHECLGGCAHKAIRWAFEAQGMHPPNEDDEHDAPGAPPPVDLYVADLRPQTETTEESPVAHGPGNYLPVSLGWSNDSSSSWFADASAPRVGNRGQYVAQEISLRIWAGSFEGCRADTDWEQSGLINWKHQADHQIDSLMPGEETPLDRSVLGFDTSSPPNLVLVEASCPDDRANSDPSAALPITITDAGPPRSPRYLADLVANDNNLGLYRLGG